MSLGETYYDSDIYDNAGQGGKSRYDGYVTSIAANDEVEDEDVENVPISQKRSGYTAPASILNDIAQVCSIIDEGWYRMHRNPRIFYCFSIVFITTTRCFILQLNISVHFFIFMIAINLRRVVAGRILWALKRQLVIQLGQILR